MFDMTIPKLIIKELCTSRRKATDRLPEPTMAMVDDDQVRDYADAGADIMAPTHLFHTAQACTVIAPGDRVLDLACGPAVQLAHLASLRPDAQFVGVDLSEQMLQRAQAHIDELGLTNVALQRGDITDLEEPDHSFDAIVSAMSLHHLPTPDLLQRAMRETHRLLKPGGGLYLGDFGRLRRVETMRYFALMYEDRQPQHFTTDYLNSLRAAYAPAEIEAAMGPLKSRAKLYRMFPVAFLLAIKSADRFNGDRAPVVEELARRKTALGNDAARDLADMKRFFRLGGMRSELI